jgi:hypothetical protein
MTHNFPARVNTGVPNSARQPPANRPSATPALTPECAAELGERRRQIQDPGGWRRHDLRRNGIKAP